MYRISSDFELEDVFQLIRKNKEIILRGFVFDENIPNSVFLRYLMSDIEKLFNKSVLRLALKNVNDDVFGVVLVEKSDFDSDIFGFGVGKIKLFFANHKTMIDYSAHLLKFFYEIKKNVATQGLEVLFARLGLDQPIVIQCLERVGAVLTDILLTFYINVKNNAIPTSKSCPAWAIEEANRGNERELMEISRRLFKTNHFHADPYLPIDKSDEIYARWISNSLNNSKCKVFVVRIDGNISGFISCKVENINGVYSYGVIDLIGVKNEYRSKGLGTLLISKALEWFSKSTNSVYVGTQASNIPAIRTFQKTGFKIINSECDLHLWIESEKFIAD